MKFVCESFILLSKEAPLAKIKIKQAYCWITKDRKVKISIICTQSLGMVLNLISNNSFIIDFQKLTQSYC